MLWVLATVRLIPCMRVLARLSSVLLVEGLHAWRLVEASLSLTLKLRVLLVTVRVSIITCILQTLAGSRRYLRQKIRLWALTLTWFWLTSLDLS